MEQAGIIIDAKLFVILEIEREQVQLSQISHEQASEHSLEVEVIEVKDVFPKPVMEGYKTVPDWTEL